MKPSATTSPSMSRMRTERLSLMRRVAELEEQAKTLRQQRDAANAVIQQQNRIIAGDVE